MITPTDLPRLSAPTRGPEREPAGVNGNDTSHGRRPLSVRMALGGLGFVGATAIAGGLEMLAFPRGNRFLQPDWLASIPIVDSYRIPGIALAVGVGTPALGAGVGLARRHQARRPHRPERHRKQHWSRRARRLSGFALLAWLAIEYAVTPNDPPSKRSTPRSGCHS